MSDKPLRILHVFGGMNAGGAEKFIMDVFRNLDRNEIVFEFAVNTKKKCFFDQEILDLGGKIYHLPEPKVVGIKLWSKKFDQLLKKQGPFDAIHSHVFFFSGFVLKIASENNLQTRIAHSHTEGGAVNNPLEIIYRYLARTYILKYSTDLLACSKKSGEKLYSKLNKFSVIPYGINVGEFSKTNKKLKKIGLNKNNLLFGHIGRFTKSKNHRFLIEIFEQIVKREPEAKLILVGTGELENEIKRLVKFKGLDRSIIFMGTRKDISNILSILNGFIFPSFYEGLPVVLLESQAVGIKCFVSDRISSEVDSGLGLLNYLSLKDSAKNWADKILSQMKNSKADNANIKKVFIDKSFDILSATSKLKNIYFRNQEIRAVIPVEYRFFQSPDGHTWTDQLLSFSFFEKFLPTFDRVVVLARSKKINKPNKDFKRVDGPGIEVVSLPFYIGPVGYLFNFLKIKKILNSEIRKNDTVILRLPSIIGTLAATILYKRRQPFAIKVVGDPYDVFSPGASNNVFRPLYRWLFTKNLRNECKRAGAINYINSNILPKRYPPRNQGDQYISCFSDVELSEKVFKKRQISYKPGEEFKIITIGSMEHNYKGIDTLIKAVAKCQAEFPNISLGIIGDGKLRTNMEILAKNLKIKNIKFHGQLPHNDLFYQLLDESHLYIMPSRQEGLPRALLEAMSRSLPCLSTNVGGIPELLPESDMVFPNNVDELVGKMKMVIGNLPVLNNMSRRNYTKALAYEDKKRLKKQNDFNLAARNLISNQN